MIDIQKMVESKINSLWGKHSDLDLCKYPANCTKEIPESGIVFIGLNPSMSAKEKVRLEARIDKEDKACEFPLLTGDPNSDHQYFKKFYDIGKKTKMAWGHLDILYCRETSQKNIEILLGHEQGHDFIASQCHITKTILEQIINENNPRIFVVVNTLSRKLICGKVQGEYHSAGINFDFEWNETLGTYTYKNNPFFFSSMLTGQRALDNGSFERLVWHINQVKSKLKTFTS